MLRKKKKEEGPPEAIVGIKVKGITKPWLAIVIVLIIIIGIQTYLYLSLPFKYEELNIKYNNLSQKYSTLEASYKTLEDSYQSLQTNYNSLLKYKSMYETLTRDYSALEVDYNSLRSEYEALIEDYNTLKENYTSLVNNYEGLISDYNVLLENYEVETTLRIGNSLASYYDIVRIESGPWRSNTEMAQFAAKLAMHGLGYNFWPSLENEFYQKVGKHSYDMAHALLNNVLSLAGVNTSQAPIERIARILYFINKHIHYEYDMKDVILAPAETLMFKSGDCDDFTMLAASLFEAVGIDSAVAFFKSKEPGAEKQYHWMVLVYLDNLGDYDYWYYSDLTSMGLKAGKWIKIEPQYTIEKQGSEWVGKWSLLAVAPLD